MHRRSSSIARSFAARLALVGLVVTALATSALPVSAAEATTRSVCATGCVYTTIQGAIDAAVSGDTITVAAGTYTEDVMVDKAVTITGAGAATTSIVATTGNQNPLWIDASGVTVTGFTITHDYTEAELSAWNFNNNGVIFGPNSTGNTLANNVISKNRNGIYVNTQDNTISGNIITDNRTGINLAGNFTGTTISDNTISDNWTLGLVIYGPSPVDLSTVTVMGNTFDQNWYGQVLVKGTETPVDSNFTGTLDVTDNTFTDTPVTQSTSSDPSLDEPGFTDQQPVSLEGDAVKPATPGPTMRIYYMPSATLKYDAPAAPTISTVTVSPSGSALVGTAVTITGTVSPATAVGTIEIFDGTTRLGVGTATDGVFTVVTSALRAGSHSLTAKFTPANAENYQTSTSTAVPFSVNNAEVPAPPAASNPVQIVEPVAQQEPVVTEQTPPPSPVTAQIVLTELGSSTAQLLEVYQAANNGDAPPPATEVLTIAAGELEAGTGAILSTTNFVASMPWSGSSDDQWVDVWAYSTPTYIGTFPVINGVLKITGADLSALAAGDHHLVLVGQTSGASEVMGFAIAEPAGVPDDNVTAAPDAATPDVAAGSQDLGWLLWVAIATLAIAAIVTIGTVVIRRRA